MDGRLIFVWLVRQHVLVKVSGTLYVLIATHELVIVTTGIEWAQFEAGSSGCRNQVIADERRIVPVDGGDESLKNDVADLIATGCDGFGAELGEQAMALGVDGIGKQTARQFNGTVRQVQRVVQS